MPIIKTTNLSKEFKVFKREPGFKNTVKSLFHREYKIIKAVDDISFSIDKGELVGYIGPNGAGKSTTIKMLSGILYPSSGEVMVRDQVPHDNRKDNAMHIGVVFGQRSQLYWDLPMADTFRLNKKMYKIDDKRFKRNVDFYTELLDMGDFLKQPIRQLSLGQKMRAELSVALLHDPDILYLDEPTIGLDVLAKKRIREFIKHINNERQTTVILTTHDMDDIEQICNRLILIDKGKSIYDGELVRFMDNFINQSTIELIYNENIDHDEKKLARYDLKITDVHNSKKIITFDKNKYSSGEIVKAIIDCYNIEDISIKDSKIEDILTEIYEKK